MTAKEFLERGNQLESRIEMKAEQLEKLQALAESVTVAWDSLSAGGGTPNHNKLAETVERIIEMKIRIADELAELAVIKQEIHETLQQVSDIELRTLLELRYINRRTWIAISDTMGQNERWIYRLHNRGLKIVEKILQTRQ